MFSINVRVVGLGLATIVVLLVIAHFTLASRDWAAARLFHLDSEAGLATAFASIMGLAAGGVALVIAAILRHQRRSWEWWGLLGLAMMAYGVDEIAQVHEKVARLLDGPIRGVEDQMAGTALLGYLLIPAFALALWAMMRVADRKAACLIAGGLCIFWLGAFGVEELEYRNYVGQLPFTRNLPVEVGDFVLTGLQEAMELAGVALILLGTFAQLAARVGVVTVEIRDGNRSPNTAARRVP